MVVLFQNEEGDEVTSCICLSKGCVDIFASTMTFFDETDMGLVREKLNDLLHAHAVFAFKFFNNGIKPNETSDFQVLSSRCT